MTKPSIRSGSTAERRKTYTPALRNFSAGLITLSELAPKHLTLAQCAFFLTAAMADRAGRPATFTDLKEAVGPAVNRSLHSTYKIFLDEGRIRDGQRAEGLGWLEREVDPTDNRRKYLRLTAQGQAVVDGISLAITMEHAA